MKYETYIESILQKFNNHFDIYENHDLLGYRFNYAAIYNERSERYFASKKIVIDAVETNEYCLFTYIPNMTMQHFSNLTKMLQDEITNIVKPTDEHMSTIITCIIISDKITDDALIPRLQKYRFDKSFLFSLKGWAKIRFILVDLGFEEIYVSKEGDKVKEIYSI